MEVSSFAGIEAEFIELYNPPPGKPLVWHAP